MTSTGPSDGTPDVPAGTLARAAGPGATAPTTTAGRTRYRVYQLYRSVLARPLDPEERALIARELPPAGVTLFETMSRNDQRHSLTVYQALRARGCIDPDLLSAALLHDSGKGAGRVPLWARPPYVLLRAFAPGVLRWLVVRPRPGLLRPFYAAWHHPAIGAELAAKAGLSEGAVRIIRTHQMPDGPAAELHAVDDAL